MITVTPKDRSISNHQLRKQGLIPAVIFSKTKNDVVVITKRDFEKARQSHTPVLTTSAGDMVVIKEVQTDPVGKQILHVSFLHISKNQKFTQQVPLKLVHPKTNFSNQGLCLTTVTQTLEVEGTADTMVESVVVDVSHLKAHDVLRVKDLPKIKGLEYLDDPEHEVASLNYIHVEETETTTETPTEPATEKKE